MTITPLWASGMELADSRDELTASANNYAATTTPKTQTYGFNLASASGTGNYYEHSSAISQCRIALHVRHAVTSGTRDLISVYNGTTACVRVQWDATNSEWVVLCGATEVARESDAGFAVSNTYYHVGVDIKIDGTNGWVYLYRDGVQKVAFDGDTNNGFATFNRLLLGNLSIGTGWTSGVLDDVVWFSSTGEVAPAAIADYRVYDMRPNGNGNYNQMDGSDGNATDNYLLVDELPANDDTDYITTETADDTESFAMNTFTIPEGFAVEWVVPYAIARKEDALGALGLQLGTRLSTTDNVGSTQALGTGYAIFREWQDQSPAAANWTQQNLDDLEVIAKAAA